MLHILNLYSDMCQLYLFKTGEEGDVREMEPGAQWKSCPLRGSGMFIFYNRKKRNGYNSREVEYQQVTQSLKQDTLEYYCRVSKTSVLEVRDLALSPARPDSHALFLITPILLP